MSKLNFHKAIEEFDSLKFLLKEGEALGIDVSQLIGKVDSLMASMRDETVRIVLLGSFADGKTSAIAGLLGELKENMKIDMDESSDELAVYRFKGIENVEIIDTPGLFGTKEKEVDGGNVKYSDITLRYISEANILIYVCDAVTPLKESHVAVLRKILRDFNKLNSTIFVINKMDEAGFDMLDENDYQRGANIKKQVLIGRLKDAIGLTEEEANNLHIVCIAADPKGKGLEQWFSKMDSYLERSHIGRLKDSITDIVYNNDIQQLKSDTNMAVITDVMDGVKCQLDAIVEPVKQSIGEARGLTEDLRQDCGLMRRDLINSKARLLEDLHNLHESINTDIDEADLSTINSVIENKLGVADGSLDYNILDSDILMAITRCVESNNYSINSRIEEFSQKIDSQSKIVTDALKFGADKLGKIKLANTDILNVRNYLGKYFDWAKNIKFKPHGARKIAAKVSTGCVVTASVISVVLDLHSYFKEQRNLKKIAELKQVIKSDISAKFKGIYEVMNSDQSYFENFAPSYIELSKAMEVRNSELLKLQNQIDILRQYNERINKWLVNSRKQLS